MRLIDADNLVFREIDEIGGEYEPFYGCSKEQIDNAPTVDAIPRADYENRLKADLVAMLTEIQFEIEENTARWYVGRVDGKSDDVVLMETINDIIQQKITNLQVNNSKVKEQTDE